MWNLAFFIPFLPCAIHPKNWAEDLFTLSGALLILSFFPMPLAMPLWFAAASYVLLRWYLYNRLGIPLTNDLWSYILHPSSFLDSIKSLKIPQTFSFGACLISLSLLGFRDEISLLPPLFLFLLSAFFIPRKIKSQTNIPYSFQFPNEIYHLLSPQYPVLRKTIAFKGKKQFELSLHEKPNVIFLFMESFRAKNVGCLGAQIPASPHFDSLAKQGVLFSRFCANGLQTYRAFLSAFFGIPPHIETMSLKPYCSIPLLGLPEILKENGYHTALMQGGNTIFDWTYPFFRAHGFETIIGKEDLPAPPHQTTSWGVSDETLFQHSTTWMKKQKEPFFLSLFTISNHHPWEPPPGWNFPVDASLSSPYQRFLQTFSYSDHALGLFIEQLKKEDLFDNTLLFIFGDHGQGLGERKGPIDIHNDLYQENIHIPLLILGKNVTPAVIDAPASQIDLLPTLLDILQIPAIHHSLGKSLLREDSSPIFFSLPRGNPQLGSLHNSHKLICSDTSAELYDLHLDPDEKHPLPPSQDQIDEAKSYFQTVNALFQQKTWTPTQKNSFELKAASTTTHAEWIQLLASAPMASILDLSNTLLTDPSLLHISPQKAAQIHELDLSHSLFTDRSLEWIATHCTQLMILNASHCPLITNTGIHALIQKCPLLRFLSLSGIDDLTHFISPSAPTQITALLLRESRHIAGHSLAHFLSHCPQLIYLSATLEKTTQADFLRLAHNTHSLVFSWLTDGPSIDDASLASFCRQNPDLSILILEDFPLLSAPPFPPSRRLMRLKISHCPNLTDDTFTHLAHLPLKEICIASCPKITGKGLEKLLPLPDCKILISDCNLKAEEILSLRSRGLEIY